jgi:acetylornithine aminotransferase
VGEQLLAGLAHPHVAEVRGRGLLVGLDLDAEVAPQVVAAAQARGFIVNACAPDRIRLAPPLVLTAEEADSFLAAWPEILEAAYASAEGAP